MQRAHAAIDGEVLRPLRWLAVWALTACAACVHPPAEVEAIRAPSEDAAPLAKPSVGESLAAEPRSEEVERRRARARAQFEAAARGQQHSASGPHALFNCPHCVDPWKGLIPDDALINGPMPVWN